MRASLAPGLLVGAHGARRNTHLGYVSMLSPLTLQPGADLSPCQSAVLSLLSSVGGDSKEGGCRWECLEHQETWRWGKMKTVLDFIVLGSKISADGDCSQEVKRHSLLESKAMTNLDSVLKSRDISLLTKVRIILWFFQ